MVDRRREISREERAAANRYFVSPDPDPPTLPYDEEVTAPTEAGQRSETVDELADLDIVSATEAAGESNTTPGKTSPVADVHDCGVHEADPFEGPVPAVPGLHPDQASLDDDIPSYNSPTEVVLEPGVLPSVHPALLDNGFSLIHSIRIENPGPESLQGLTLTVSSDPAFCAVDSIRISTIASGGTHSCSEPALRLDREFFRLLSERTRGSLTFDLRSEERTITSCTVELDLCPPNNWPGLGIYPEFLAAFCLPNEPAVQLVLAEARKVLEEWGESPSLEGYQSKDPGRVLRLVAAVYGAFQKLGITYASPPADFGQMGQRVRLPEEVLQYKMGTCLDLSLLYAACLEQMGIHPLLILVEGHALVGLWLHEESFSEPFLEEPMRLRNHCDLAEIALVDVTAASTRPALSFDVARDAGSKHVSLSDQFLCAIDVHRARKGKVRPIATLIAGPTTTSEDVAGIATKPSTAPRTENVEHLDRMRQRSEELSHDPTIETRLDNWCRKLLDLTMRNRLLNFRPGKKTIPLLCSNAGSVEDALADGATFRVKQRPRELEEDSGLRRPGLSRKDAVAAILGMLEEDLQRHTIHADLAKEDLEKRLVNLYRDARSAAEEGGTSNLYLAIGFLVYRETKASRRPRKAPILLLPIELHRSTVRGGVTLSLGADEPRLNATLMEFLRQDHSIDVPGLDPLPEDDSGLDVPLILQTVRSSIRGLDGWLVEEELTLGFFSFAKILIWKDLMERRDELLKNPLVNHLVHSYNEEWEDGVSFPSLEELDDEHPATDVLCPTSADSSQLAAVLAAAEGKSFVLKGPPGTGKSQTITNLIAHSLADGKRILFVSAKMAALEVVHERLKSVGIAEACLELHSSKAKKKEVLEQLRQALHASTTEGGRDWERAARELNELRHALNAYVRALHRRYPSGDSPFTALSRLTGLANVPEIEIDWKDVASTTEEKLERANATVRLMADAAMRAEVRPGHPFFFIERDDCTMQWERDAEASLRSLGTALEKASKASSRTLVALGFSDSPALPWPAHETLAPLLEHLLALPATGIPEELLSQTPLGILGQRTEPWALLGKRVQSQKQALAARYRELPTCLPLDDLHRLAQEAHTVWAFPAWLKRRQILKAFRSVAMDPRRLTLDQARKDLDSSRTLRDETLELSNLGGEAVSVLGFLWNGPETDWKVLGEAVQWATNLAPLLDSWRSSSGRSAGETLGSLKALIHSGSLAPESETVRTISAHLDAWRFLCHRVADVRDLLSIRERIAHILPEGDGLEAFTSLTNSWLSTWREIPKWCAWRRARTAAVESDLDALVNGLEDGTLRCEELSSAFQRAYTDSWFTAVSSLEPTLSHFLGSEREAQIARFRKLDDELLRLTHAELRRRIIGRPMSGRRAPSGSEAGILQRELTKKTRHKAIRRLFREIPTLLPRLKPCLLMSPMSVAQYLETTREPFDLLVFDEASQIPVWDAIGSIARAKQMVVVGDPEQLPPTSFFDRSDSEGEEDLVEDQESILDECLASRFSELSLDWHYRSRHEDLITFSNHRYYENRLITFPSCDEENLGVSFHFVEDGVYDRGGSTTNQVEARALVAEVVRRLKDPELSKWSLGVVTFNQSQQHLIENLLDDERRKLPELEEAFSPNNPGAVFVKNLENVQGDERDVILFSIAYGPDSNGRIYVNFGPLTKPGGHRRLNVAITRARREVVIFSSMRADQIPIERARAQGVKDLRLYLDYAERGPGVLGRERAFNPSGDVESPFEAEVKKALEHGGFQVHSQVGCSGYRIDLGIVDPDRPGRYLLGVECDGATYHSAKTARDRDKLRQDVLEGLGWRLHRIWSTEWWRYPREETARILQAIEDARRSSPPAAESSAPRPGPGPAAITTPEEPRPFRSETSPQQPAVHVAEIPPGTPFVLGSLPKTRRDQYEFYLPKALPLIRRAVENLVRIEGPVSVTTAVRRVGSRWGLQRIRDKARQQILGAIQRSPIFIEDDHGEWFLWSDDQAPRQYSTFRLPNSEPESHRQPQDVSTREFANACRHLLEEYGGICESDLLRELGRLFGYARIGQKVRARLMGGLLRLRESGAVLEDDGMIRLTD